MSDDTEPGDKRGGPFIHAVGYFLSALGIVLMLVAGFCTLMFGGVTLNSAMTFLAWGIFPLLLGIGLYILGVRMIRR